LIGLWLACAGSPTPVGEVTQPPCHEDLAAVSPSDGSLYDLGTHLETAAGARVTLDRFRGKPLLIAMFYASCREVCPLTIAKLEGIAAKLSPDVAVLMVSFDPERDDPPALARLAAEHHLDGRFTLARTSNDEVRELSAALGVKYRRTADGDFNHSTVITLLDRRGVVAARIEGLAASDAVIVDAAARL
jgi:protein SCO1/2